MSNTARDWTPANVRALPSASQKIDDDELDLSEFIELFFNRKWWILAAILLAAFLGFLYVQQQPSLYPAQAKLILDAEESNVAGLDSFVPGISDDDTEMNSQIEVIKSRRLIGQVVDKLNLDEDPEYVSNLRPPSIKSRAVKWVKSTIGVEAEDPTPEMLREKAIDQLTENINASVVPNTYVFKISLESESPKKSVDIVNTLGDFFIADQITAKQESTEVAAAWLREKVAGLGRTLGEAEAKAANFRSQTERAVTEQDLAQSNLNLKNARGRLESFISNLEAATGSRVPATDSDLTRVNTLIRDVNELEAITEKQTDDLLIIRQLDREAVAAGTIYQHFAQRLNEIEVQTGLQESDVRTLSAAVLRQEPTKPRKVFTIALFAAFGLILSLAYILFRKFMDRSFNDPAELQSAYDIPVIGTIPRSPEFPAQGISKKSREAKKRQALLRYVLKFPGSRMMEAIRDLRTSLLSSERKKKQSGPPVGAASATGTVVVFTSSIPAEGKTTSSILLAMNLADLDKKVLLVECDLRRSTFETYFGPQTKLGLIDAIQADKDWKKAVWSDRATPTNKKVIRPVMKMDVIFGGVSKTKNAADIFASDQFEVFIERAKAEYDLVILDAPPVLPVPDARLIAKLSDKVVYVIKAGQTPSSTVSAGLRLFETMNLRLDGLVLTQMKKDKRYGYEYYVN